jgi:ATP-dependent exoDNAse (exonuclease V) alpha subunit
MTQQEALDILRTGNNVYLTGSAGSGKTFVLSQYLLYLKQQGVKVGVTASTGVASTQLSGMTIHAWSGLGVREKVDDHDISELVKRKYLIKRYEKTQVLIIDEVSMLSSKTLEGIDTLCRAFKDSNLPFGGMQIVLCGDFFQLPPVSNSSSDFIYESQLWKELDLKICYLDKSYRQSDERFIKLLTDIRENNVTAGTWDTLRERFIDPITPGMTPTRLFTHNFQADLINSKELEKLKGEEYIYDLESKGNPTLTEFIKKNSQLVERLVLKERALVMFIKNSLEQGYVNGTMGRLIGFSPDNYPIVETFEGREIIVRPSEWIIDDEAGERALVKQLPLRLAWAITIHKSQGMTLDAAEIDLGRTFVRGMGYVALSRVRSLHGLRLKSINPTALKVNEEVIQFDRELRFASQQVAVELRDAKWNKENVGRDSQTKI